MQGIILLFSFMSRLFVPKVEFDSLKLGKSMKFFPIVGFVIGLLICAISFLFKYLIPSFSLNLLIIIAVITEVISTGGLHLDGLGDTFDGIFSYRSKQKMLEIMKDSRLGTNGALVLILYFIVKIVILQEISTFYRSDLKFVFALIIIMLVVGRLNSVLNCAVSPYARPTGSAKSFVDNTSFKSFLLSLIISLIIIFGIFVCKDYE